MPFLYGGLALLAGALALIAVWSRRAPLWKTVAVALLVATLGLGYLAHIELLSRPKPLGMELADLDEARVISAVLREDEAIYLWLEVGEQPRYYAMEWDKKLAIELQAVMREARRSGASVALRGTARANESAGVEPDDAAHLNTFYAVPSPIRPPEKAPVIVRGPEWEM